jgi:alpha-mannosidase
MVTVFENQASDHLVEVLFPTGLHAEHYHAEQPFDAVRRAIRIPDPEVLRGGHDPELVDVSDEPPAVSQPQLGFIDVSDEKQGLMIANKGLISAGVLDDPSRTIAMTLLRCTDRLYRSEFADCADLRIPEAQCLKRFSFEYSIIPHEGNWENGLASCREFQLPLRGQTRRTPLSRIYDQDSAQEKSLPDRFAFLEMDCGHVEVTTVKKCEHRQSLIVRIVNIQENGKTVRFRVNSPARRFTAAFSCSLNENRLEPIPLDTDGWIEIALGAKKIATIELTE